jgi:ATP-dependent protease ClpP protease subunit
MKRRQRLQVQVSEEPLDFYDDVAGDAAVVKVVRNHIYFYGEVSSDSVRLLVEQLQTLDIDLRKQALEYPYDLAGSLPVCLHILSGGGELFPGLAAVDAIEALQSPVHTYAEGLCASAATFLLLAGKERFVAPNAFILIHQFSTSMWGTHEAFKDEMRLQDKLMDKLVAFYVQRTTLQEARLREMLKRDYWMDAEEAVASGFGLIARGK